MQEKNIRPSSIRYNDRRGFEDASSDDDAHDESNNIR